MADKEFQVVMKVFAFDNREAAEVFLEAMTDAFMAMPEAEGYAAVAEVVELPTEDDPNG